jgi:hypothetical protein
MKIFIILIAISLFACNTKTIVLSEEAVYKQKQSVNQLLDDWHNAAAVADLDAYFKKMSNDAIYLGTDISEKWNKNEFYNFCKPYFDKGKAWVFLPSKRTIYISQDFQVAWFEESLDTWMGSCRGSGVLLYENNEWKIVHYNLAVAVSNEIIKDYIKLLEE